MAVVVDQVWNGIAWRTRRPFSEAEMEAELLVAPEMATEDIDSTAAASTWRQRMASMPVPPPTPPPHSRSAPLPRAGGWRVGVGNPAAASAPRAGCRSKAPSRALRLPPLAPRSAPRGGRRSRQWRRGGWSPLRAPYQARAPPARSAGAACPRSLAPPTAPPASLASCKSATRRQPSP